MDWATWSMEPYQRSIKVVADGVERFVVTCVMGRQLSLSSSDPWLSKTDRLPFPVDVSLTADVLTSEVVTRSARKALDKVRSQYLHHTVDHNVDPPHSLTTARARALEVQDEVESGFQDLATRADVWVRITVAGATEAEGLNRAGRVKDLYSPGVTIVQPAGQMGLAREHVPGEPLSCSAHRRRLPVTTLAAGMPAATASVGHANGLYLGYTAGAGGHHAVRWSTHRSMEQRERSGLTLVAGVPGAGKSALMFQVVYQSALQGTMWVVLDPAGAMARLTELPELEPWSRHTDLMSAQPGSLNTYRVIADPLRANFEGVGEFEHACSMVAGQRRQLTADILQQLLPPAIGDQAVTQIALRSGCALQRRDRAGVASNT